MVNRLETGLEGEEKAVLFLRQNGYKILERNARNSLGELDIVALDKDTVCFVEVRCRQGVLTHSDAFESVNLTKQKKLSKLAVAYLRKKKWFLRRARFDVVSVLLGADNQVRLIKDAFPVVEKYA